MDRNWLIRTTQNQILGPVAKQKLLEFIEKGALGLNDEVASGNGYWFALREKDLVDKYIYGDIPQGYNPISESKSVLFKRENPEKTSSINTAPANKTQSVKVSSHDGPVILPKEDDLEFPDIGGVSSTVPSSQVENTDLTKLPNQEDLEFPDITMMTSNPMASFSGNHGMQTEHQSTPVMTPVKRAEPVSTPSQADEDVVYPKDEDLDFPDVDSIVNKVKDKTFEFKVDLNNNTQTVAIKTPDVQSAVTAPPAKKGPMEIEAGEDLGELTLTVVQPKLKEEDAVVAKPQAQETKDKPLTLARKKDSIQKEQVREAREAREIKEQKAPKEERLLHDRKVKAAPKVPVRENREVVSIENAPIPLKKRNDNYIFFILIIVALIMLAVFFYFREILNKPLPV